MIIQSSNSSPSVAPAGGSGSSSQIQQLQKQIQALEKQVSQENSSSDDAKTKAQMDQMYQLQIQELQMEIQQLQQQNAQKSAAKQNDPAASNSGVSGVTDTQTSPQSTQGGSVIRNLDETA